jgi:hypothetical protein
MAAPYRINKLTPTSANATISDVEGVTTTGVVSVAVEKPTAVARFQSYVDRLMKMIPGEVIGLYLVGSGLIPGDQKLVSTIWIVICFIGVIVARIYGTRDPNAQHPIDWLHVAISAVSFLIWIYSLGRLLPDFIPYVSYIGSLMVLAWTFFVPIFYQGAD